MIYGFETDDGTAATAALLVYAIYRSRDLKRYKVRPDMWGQIERFTKAAAKRADTVGTFIESLKPRLLCDTLRPRAMAVGRADVGRGADRTYLHGVLEHADHTAVLRLLYRETSYVILLVRDRLERERPIESRIERDILADDMEEAPTEEGELFA